METVWTEPSYFFLVCFSYFAENFQCSASSFPSFLSVCCSCEKIGILRITLFGIKKPSPISRRRLKGGWTVQRYGSDGVYPIANRSVSVHRSDVRLIRTIVPRTMTPIFVTEALCAKPVARL